MYGAVSSGRECWSLSSFGILQLSMTLPSDGCAFFVTTPMQKNHVHRDPVLCLMNSLREYHCLCIGVEQESPNGK